MELGNKRRVELNCDLTRYDDRCTTGSKGWTLPLVKFGMYGSFDHFVAVEFDSGAKLDIALNSLNILEEKKVKKVKEFNIKQYPKLKTLEKRAMKLKIQHDKLKNDGIEILLANKVHEKEIRARIQNALRDW